MAGLGEFQADGVTVKFAAKRTFALCGRATAVDPTFAVAQLAFEWPVSQNLPAANHLLTNERLPYHVIISCLLRILLQ